MRIVYILTLLLLGALLLVPISAQQIAPDGLYIGARPAEPSPAGLADLYRYDLTTGALDRVTADGGRIGFRSNGTTIAYQTLPGFLRGTVDPANLAQRGTAWDIAAIDTSGRTLLTENGLTRSAPAWSPDGSALAWIEQDAMNAPRLVTYKLDDGTTTVIDGTLTPQTLSPDGLPRLFDWGMGGLAVFSNDLDGNGIIQIFTPEVGLIGTAALGPLYGPDVAAESRALPPLDGPLWVLDNGNPAIYVRLADGSEHLIAPDTGNARPLDGMRIALAAAANPAESIRAVPLRIEGGGVLWSLRAADGTVLVEEPARLGFTSLNIVGHDVAIAPDGTGAAWTNGVRVNLWRDGAAQPLATESIAEIDALLWGATVWITVPG